MSGATDRGYPYPDGGDPVTLALYIRQLAQAVNDDVDQLASQPWVALTLDSGFTSNSNYYAPAYRLQGTKVELRGAVVRSAGNFPAGFTSIVSSPPSAMVPAKFVEMVIATSSNSDFTTCRLELAGSLKVCMASASAGTVYLDGATYNLV